MVILLFHPEIRALRVNIADFVRCFAAANIEMILRLYKRGFQH